MAWLKISHTLRWLWWPAASFPVAVLSHELAHYLAYRAFDFPAPALHYASASSAAGDAFWKKMQEGDIVAATQLMVPWQAGVSAAAGLLATYVTVAAALMLTRRRPHPFVVGLGLVAPLRSVGSAVALPFLILGRRSGTDEEHVAMTLHLPELALHVLGIGVLVAAWRALFRIPSHEARRGRTAALGGIVLGAVLYLGIIGPWLLP